MNHVKHTNRRGFTLIELLLAMSFIAVLLLAIATVTLMISQVYNRGLTLKEVNQLSRTISDDLLRDISASPTFSLDASGAQYANPNPNGTSGQAASGRLCTGTYSYIWNYGWALTKANSGVTQYTNSNDQIRFVRIPDADSSYCAVLGNGKFVKAKVDKAVAVELLSASDHDLVLHQFNVTTSTTAVDTVSGQRLYAVSFTLGTNDQNALQNNGGVISCKPPSMINADPTYCSVQQFSLVARTQYGVN